MIELIVYQYLTNKLNNVGVYMEFPENPTFPFVVIDKTGSRMDNHIKGASITVMSYHNSKYNAVSLNETVKEAMLNIVERSDVSSCDLDTDSYYPDTERKLYRYQSLFDIKHY